MASICHIVCEQVHDLGKRQGHGHPDRQHHPLDYLRLAAVNAEPPQGGLQKAAEQQLQDDDGTVGLNHGAAALVREGPRVVEGGGVDVCFVAVVWEGGIWASVISVGVYIPTICDGHVGFVRLLLHKLILKAALVQKENQDARNDEGVQEHHDTHGEDEEVEAFLGVEQLHALLRRPALVQ